MKRILSALLALTLVLGLLPGWAAPAEAAPADDLEALIRDQVIAFADSVAQSNSHEEAAMALANHAITKKGAALQAGKNHPLTACLYSSNLLRVSLPHMLVTLVQTMQQMDLSTAWGKSGCSWYSYGHTYYCHCYPSRDDASERYLSNASSSSRYGSGGYPGPFNAQDETLLWMAGGTYMDIDLHQSAVSAEKVSYKVKIRIYDRFDFNGEYSNVKGDATFEKVLTLLGSALGKLMFQEFDWSSTAEFTLTVPNPCAHGSGNYHWTYDPEGNRMVNDDSGDFLKNATTPHLYSSTNQKTGVTTSYYYYELDQTVRLMHDKPWVMEYTVKKPGNIAFSPISTNTSVRPYLVQLGSSMFYAAWYDRVKLTDAEKEAGGYKSNTVTYQHFYGTPLRDLFKYSSKYTYTFRLENVIAPGGSNMVYLTVINQDLQETVLEKTALNDYYLRGPGSNSREPQGVESDWVSGKDFYVNYIGCRGYKLSAEYLDITIWENGRDIPSGNSFRTKVTAPTCTAEGHTTYTCAYCGYSYRGDKTPVAEHSYTAGEKVPGTCTAEGYTVYTCSCGDSYHGDFTSKAPHDYATEVKRPTCTEEGSMTYTCRTCGITDRDVTGPATGHSYTATVTQPTCTEAGYTTHTCPCGDSFVDSHVPATGHRMGDYRPNGDATCTADGTLSSACALCGMTDTVEDPGSALGHRGGAATCRAAAICEICGQGYGEKNTANHTGGEEVRDAVAAEEFKEGYTGNTFCLGCGVKVKNGQILPATHVHSYGEIWAADEDSHWKACSCGEKSEEADHIPGPNATTTAAQTCTVCGWELNPVLVQALGDVNGDGKINPKDAAMVLQHFVDKPVQNFNAAAADVNADGKINPKDAAMILQYFVGKIPGFV